MLMRPLRSLTRALRAHVRQSASPAGAMVQRIIQSSILENDDFFRHGLPGPKFLFRSAPPFQSARDARSCNHELTSPLDRILSQFFSQSTQSNTHTNDSEQSSLAPSSSSSSSTNSSFTLSHPSSGLSPSPSSSSSSFFSSPTSSPISTSASATLSAPLSAGALLRALFHHTQHVDPFALADPDMRTLAEGIREIVSNDHPILQRVAKYFVEVKGKRVRPVAVLLMARAAAALQPEELAQAAPNAAQQKLSEITEIIHTASLLHDDVLDDAETRRGVQSVNNLVGSKMAVLGGDFLLARASVALANLRNPDVIILLSQVIEHLVKGELMQMRPVTVPKPSEQFASALSLFPDSDSAIESYITKTYYKTASLFANSCKASVVLGGLESAAQEIAYEYGKHFGLTFQIVDDLLDFVGSESAMGKPTLSDLRQGIATLPVLFAAQQFPELRDMISRKFRFPTDIDRALDLVVRGKGIERARERAMVYAEGAVAAVCQLPPSSARDALINLVDRVLSRDR